MANPAVKEKGEAKAEQFIFRDFHGINTQAARIAINDEQFYWIENWMPIGLGNAKVVPAPSSSLATVTSGSCNYMVECTIGSAAHAIMFCNDGSAYDISLPGYVKTVIGVAGTFSTSGVRATMWKNERLLIIDPSKGYTNWDGTTLAAFDAGHKGTAIAVYSYHVWIASNRTVTFSDTNSYNSFAGVGGSFIMTDPTLHGPITGLYTANGFMYIFGVDSIDVVSNVNVVGGVLVYSKTNVTSSVGTAYDTSINSFLRTLVFATNAGFYALNGATPLKISDALDNIFPFIDFTYPVSSGYVFIYNQLCQVFSFRYNDGTTPRNLMAVYFNEKWFLASQGSSLVFIANGNVSNIDNLYATDGTSLFLLFTDTAAAINSKIITKLWDFENPISNKQALKAGFSLSPSQVGTQSISVTLDTENQVSPVMTFTAAATLTWLNNSMGVIIFTNASSGVLIWTVSGTYIFAMSDAEMGGSKYLGLTITSSSPGMAINLMALQYKQRAQW